MQTFLPYPDFRQTAKVLDRQRLGKQRIETKQIIQTLLGESSGQGWANHPAVLMWEGFEARLCVYGLYICDEWRRRGYEDNQFAWFDLKRKELSHGKWPLYPDWFGDERLHESHRRKLVWKFPSHYGPTFDLPDEPFGEPEYYWPVLEVF